MSEKRETLKPHLNKRITIRGTFNEWRNDWTERAKSRSGIDRITGRACIANPEMDHEVVATHVWVNSVSHWEQHSQSALGLQVSFDAIVSKYRTKDGETSYCLSQAGELTILHGPPCIPIPDLSQDDQMPETKQFDDAPTEPDAISPFDAFRFARQVAKKCGGLPQALEVAKLLEETPISIIELKNWLQVMSED
jgi:hypothetical protein